MPRFRSVITALLVLVGLGATLQFGAWLALESISPRTVPAAGPRLQVVSHTTDLGRVSPGDSLLARFVIANTGQDPLVIRELQGNCCDKSESLPPVTTIQPGRTTEIAVTADAARLRTNGQQHFRFVTNDRRQPELWLTVRGTVAPRPERSVLVKRP